MNNINQHLENFLEHLTVVRGLSLNTVNSYKFDLSIFFEICKKDIKLITKKDIKNYIADMAIGSISAKTQARRLSCLRTFFKFMLANKTISQNPMLDIELPKLPKSLPKALTKEDVNKILEHAKGESPEKLRINAILSILYSAGLRVSELASLKMQDVREGEGELLRITGKGDKTRIIPLGSKAKIAVEEYISKGRSSFDKFLTNDYLFPSTRKGQHLSRIRIYQLILEHAKTCGVNAKITPHVLRHTFATHLVENDADLRAVQLMLGHSDVTTTEIYTKIADNRMQNVVNKHHPLVKGKKEA